MPTTLGSAFAPEPTVEPDPDGDADRALLAAVQELTDKVATLEIPAPRISLPAPQVRVDVPPVPAVPTAAEIGEAVARSLPRDDDSALLLAVTSVKDAVDKLAKKTTAPRFGTSGGLGGAAFDSAGNLKVVTSGGSSGGLTDTQLRATPVPVSGTVSTGLTQPLTDTQLRATPVSVSGTVSTGGLTDTQIRATPLPISGTVSTGLTQPLTDTQMRATPVPVSGTVATGGLTDTQLRATPVPVSGTVSTGLTQPLTDAQIRATPVPVSGTVSTGLTQPLTDAQLRATAVPVSLATNTPTLAAGTNTVGNLNEIRAATTYATIVSTAVSLGATLTLPAAGVGLFHYITSIEIVNYTGIARTGGATPVTVTTTNITGNPAYTFATAAAIGTTDIQRPILATPLKVAAANTATTFVAPVTTGSFWRIQVTYFVGA